LPLKVLFSDAVISPYLVEIVAAFLIVRLSRKFRNVSAIPKFSPTRSSVTLSYRLLLR
jgi:hypothetical protein